MAFHPHSDTATLAPSDLSPDTRRAVGPLGATILGSTVATTGPLRPTAPAAARPEIEHLEAAKPHLLAAQLAASYVFENRLIASELPEVKASLEGVRAALALERTKLTESLARSLTTTGMDAETAQSAARNIATDIAAAHAASTEKDPQKRFTELYRQAAKTAKAVAGEAAFPGEDSGELQAYRKQLAEETTEARLREHMIAAAGPGGNRVDALMALWGKMSAGDTTKTIVQRDQLINAGHAFVQRAQEKGLLRLSPQELKEAGAALGVMQARIATDITGRGIANVVIKGITHSVPAAVMAAVNGLGEIDLFKRDEKGNLTFSGMDAFTESLKKAGVKFGDNVQDVFKSTALAIESSERGRVTGEMWVAMRDTGENPALGQMTLSADDLKALPESLITKIMTRQTARKPGFKREDISLYHLAQELPQDVRRLATMNTGAMARADAQNDQDPYTMSFHDVSMWGVLGGQPAPGMMRYARSDVGQEPPTRYTHHSRGSNRSSSMWAPFGMHPMRADDPEIRGAYRDNTTPFDRARMRGEYGRGPAG